MSVLGEWLQEQKRWVLLSVAVKAVGIEEREAHSSSDVFVRDIGEYLVSADDNLPVPMEYGKFGPKIGELLILCQKPQSQGEIQRYFDGAELLDPYAENGQAKLITFPELAVNLLSRKLLFETHSKEGTCFSSCLTTIYEGEALGSSIGSFWANGRILGDRYIPKYPQLPKGTSERATTAIERLHKSYPYMLSREALFLGAVGEEVEEIEHLLGDNTLLFFNPAEEEMSYLLTDQVIEAVVRPFSGSSFTIKELDVAKMRIARELLLDKKTVDNVVADMFHAGVFVIGHDQLVANGLKNLKELEDEEHQENQEDEGVEEVTTPVTKIEDVSQYVPTKPLHKGAGKLAAARLYEDFTRTYPIREIDVASFSRMLKRTGEEGTGIARYRVKKRRKGVTTYADGNMVRTMDRIPSRGSGVGITLPELAEATSLSESMVSYIVDRLVRLKFVLQKGRQYFRNDGGSFVIKMGLPTWPVPVSSCPGRQIVNPEPIVKQSTPGQRTDEKLPEPSTLVATPEPLIHRKIDAPEPAKETMEYGDQVYALGEYVGELRSILATAAVSDQQQHGLAAVQGLKQYIKNLGMTKCVWVGPSIDELPSVAGLFRCVGALENLGVVWYALPRLKQATEGLVSAFRGFGIECPSSQDYKGE